MTCAVCDKLNAPMLLGIDVIDRLFAHSLTEVSGEIQGDENDDDCVSECVDGQIVCDEVTVNSCLLYTSPSPRDRTRSRMPSSA